MIDKDIQKSTVERGSPVLDKINATKKSNHSKKTSKKQNQLYKYPDKKNHTIPGIELSLVIIKVATGTSLPTNSLLTTRTHIMIITTILIKRIRFLK